MALAAVADKNTTKDEKADDLNEDVTASLSALFAMLPGFDNTPKVTDAPSTVLPTEKPTLFTKLTSEQLTTAQPDDAPGTPAQPLTPLVAEAQSKAYRRLPPPEVHGLLCVGFAVAGKRPAADH